MSTDKRTFVRSESGRLWWVDDPDVIGEFLFSFDKHTVYNLFSDDWDKLTARQKAIFKEENPVLYALKEG